ncbi:uncharacterized protein LOC119745999 isoform X2 [Patiria miniata]|uniref:Uncharacterized protein n=1 Tax=Patiria miniata TaxID=46514 RepID=A0A914BT33_PATMI|nr:uncharacterized protein LOC119745999 isoform X2 [Patiria miniata]
MDVIGRRSRYKVFEDLRGSVWAYNYVHSLSGFGITHRGLEKIGENKASFFGSHLKSIQMILNKTTDGTGIDSNTLALQMKGHPELRDKLHVVTSWGPLPVYPGVVNSELPESQNIYQQASSQHASRPQMASSTEPIHGVQICAGYTGSVQRIVQINKQMFQ